MATIEEKFDSRETVEGDNPSITLKYVIKGTDSDIEAKALLWTSSPGIYDGLVRQSWSVEYHGPSMWLGTVRYGLLQQQPETGQSVFQFDTGGGFPQNVSTLGQRSRRVRKRVGLTVDWPTGLLPADVTNWLHCSMLRCPLSPSLKCCTPPLPMLGGGVTAGTVSA